MHLKKLDLANTTLFPFSWISILVIAVKLASPACDNLYLNRHNESASVHIKENVFILFAILELHLKKYNLVLAANEQRDLIHFIKRNKSFKFILGLGTLASGLNLQGNQG